MMVSLREKYPLEKRKAIKKTISFLPILLFIIFIVFIFFPTIFSEYFNFSNIYNIILASIFLTILYYIYQIFYIKYYFYDLVDRNLIIRKGVFSRNEITLPIDRIQDVYVDQDILDRIFRLYDVHVSSATYTSHNLCHIDGVSKESAQAIKNLLLSKINKKGR